MSDEQSHPAYRHDDYKRIYRREHPIAIWLTLGIAVTGFVALLFPDTVNQTAISLALPHWLRQMFYLSYTVGGTVAAIGLLTVNHKFEAAGLTLLASALLAQYIAVVYTALDISPRSVWSSTFVLALAIGCGSRALLLVRSTSEVDGAR